MKDVISIGDATLDTFIELEDAIVTKNGNGESLCLPFADKIPIHQLVKKVAGNAANVAVGTSRLGLTSAFWTKLGDDIFAKDVLKKMKEEGVSTRYVQKEKGKESNFTVVLNYKGERTQLIHRVPRNYDLPNNLEKAKFVYLTAMGENHQLAYTELLEYLIKYKVKLAYNPGKYQITCKEKICNDLLPYTEIVFVNKEEAELILEGKQQNRKGGKKMGKSYIKDIMKRLHEAGPEIVVVTDGPNGSYALIDNKYYHLGIFDGPVVERTGAGDAYATGFLSAILHGKTTQEAMIWGTFNSWSVVQYIGPIDGLLTKAKMHKLQKQNPNFKPVEI